MPTKSTTINRKFTDMKKIASSLNTWLRKESKTYSILCGESFTRAEVLAMNALTVFMIVAAIVAGNIFAY